MRNTTVAKDVRIELLRVLGALSVFTYHFMGDVDTVLRPGFSDSLLWATIRHVSGPFGVSVFILVSGIVFGWAWSRPAGPVRFVQRRLKSLFPVYWWIALPLIGAALLTHRMGFGELWKTPIWLSGLGILSPRTFFPVVDGWWYMTLALQLAVSYPFLRKLQERIGDSWFLFFSAAVCTMSVLLLNAMGLQYAVAGFVGSRLLEFACGMVVGRHVSSGEKALPQWRELLVLLLVCVAGVAVSRTLSGASALAVFVVVIVLAVMRNSQTHLAHMVTTAGGLTFAFFLSHSPWAKPILTVLSSVTSTIGAMVAGGFVALTFAVLVAWFFKWSFDSVLRAGANYGARGRATESPNSHQGRSSG